MTEPIPLSRKLGEVMAPRTLVTALIVSPNGQVTVDAGALHGRSELEGRLTFADSKQDVATAQVYWIAWVAIELNADNAPFRYKGIAVSEMLVDVARRHAYKSLADNVNRMTDAISGGVKLGQIPHDIRLAIKKQLQTLGTQQWERAGDGFRGAFDL